MFISSLFGCALVLGCGGGKGESDSNDTKTGPTSAAEAGDTTGAVTDGGSDTGAPTSGPGTSGATGTGTTTDAVVTEGGSDSGDTCNFLCPTTGGEDSLGPQCDVFNQDCPEGEKCAAFIEGGENAWNATKCVPITGEGVPGDACTAEGGGGTGLDDCQKGAFCWDVDMENKGICVELCGGSEAAPTCSDEAMFNCVVVNEGVLNLCLPGCDPLVQNCPGDDLCITSADSFVCAPDASGAEGQAFDACEYANVCDKGLLCLTPSSAIECDANAGGCCLPMCDLSDPNVVCPGQGQKCVSIYEAGMAPPEFENVGYCVIPE
jgi:hypothetical protein